MHQQFLWWQPLQAALNHCLWRFETAASQLLVLGPCICSFAIAVLLLAEVKSRRNTPLPELKGFPMFAFHDGACFQGTVGQSNKEGQGDGVT